MHLTNHPNLNLGVNEKKVLKFFQESEHLVYSFDNIAQAVGLERPIAKRATRMLAKRGLVRLATGFWEDNGRIAGKGYTVTAVGEGQDLLAPVIPKYPWRNHSAPS